MPDVSQFRTDLEDLSTQYASTLATGAPGRTLLPHVLLALMLLQVLNKMDEILEKLEDDED